MLLLCHVTLPYFIVAACANVITVMMLNNNNTAGSGVAWCDVSTSP